MMRNVGTVVAAAATVAVIFALTFLGACIRAMWAWTL